jgi:hypothetical protein
VISCIIQERFRTGNPRYNDIRHLLFPFAGSPSALVSND